MWSFWVACAFAAIGAVAPLAFSIGDHSRLTGVVIPFGIAAVALGANAVVYHRGRPLAVALYFIAGMAIVYGALAMLAVPIRLAVVGTCAAGAAKCPPGLEQPLTSGENNGLTAATFCGVLAVFIGFFGLLVLYRRRTAVAREQAAVWPAQPPAKTTPEPAAAAPPTPAPADSTPAVHAESEKEVAEEPKELPAPAEAKELPEPAEAKELPEPLEAKELPPPA